MEMPFLTIPREKDLGVNSFKYILELVGITMSTCRLMLLDEKTLKAVQKDTDSW